MQTIEETLKKYTVVLQIILAIVAGYFLVNGINRPLTDYDEATYAKVVVDTLKSGDILSFKLSGDNWYEKPPFYLWTAMGSVKIFGEKEFAFRIPSIIGSLMCLWLTYLIARKLTNSELVGIVAFLLLLFTPVFIFYSREMRLDSSVLAAILAAFYLWIIGLENEKYFFWIFPLVAVGFLFKSVIVLLLGLALFIYSFFYQKWLWLENKYLWHGLSLALIIFIPWHTIQISRFGHDFLSRYFGYDVYRRATTTVTGSGKYYDYISDLWIYNKAWLAVLIGIFAIFIFFVFKNKIKTTLLWKSIVASFITALSIIALFSIAKTHLTPYIMPAYPFIAIFVSLLVFHLSKQYRKSFLIYFLIFIPLLTTGIYYCFSPRNNPNNPLILEEASVGQIYKKSEINNPAPLYGLGWPYLETINYYGNTKTQFLGVEDMSGKKLKGPFYIVTTTAGASYFFYPYNGQLKSMYESLRLIYAGKYGVLMYSSEDINFPAF
ncbi:MAG: glycosyltransferase family 39 protein [Minisyncoccia bacterium]